MAVDFSSHTAEASTLATTADSAGASNPTSTAHTNTDTDTKPEWIPFSLGRNGTKKSLWCRFIYYSVVVNYFLLLLVDFRWIKFQRTWVCWILCWQYILQLIKFSRFTAPANIEKFQMSKHNIITTVNNQLKIKPRMDCLAFVAALQKCSCILGVCRMILQTSVSYGTHNSHPTLQTLIHALTIGLKYIKLIWSRVSRVTWILRLGNVCNIRNDN